MRHETAGAPGTMVALGLSAVLAVAVVAPGATPVVGAERPVAAAGEPTIAVMSTAASFDGGQVFDDPKSVIETGAVVTFDVAVTNTSTETVWLVDLASSAYGDITATAPDHPRVMDTTCELGIPDAAPPTGGIAPGETYECGFVAEVARSDDRELEHRDVVSAVAVDADGTSTPTATDDEVLAFTLVPPTVSMTKSDGDASVTEPGGNVTYVLEIANTSNEPVTITGLTDLVTYTSPQTVSVEVDLLDPTPPVVESNCSAATVPPSDVHRCEFVLGLAGTPQLVSDVAEVAVVDDDAASGLIAPVTATASDSTPITLADTVAVVADLAIVKSASAEVVDQGRPVAFELRVVNNGPDTATEVLVVDDVPAAFEVIGVASPDFGCDADGNTVRCARAELAVGARGTIVVQAVVNAGVVGTVSNTAAVTGGVPDPDPADNSSTDSIVVPDVAVLPPPTSTAPVLPRTGSDPAGLAAIALAALTGGCALVIGSVRRRRGPTRS
jgi:uncharacterized repeat protein (TIGR01451 family)